MIENESYKITQSGENIVKKKNPIKKEIALFSLVVALIVSKYNGFPWEVSKKIINKIEYEDIDVDDLKEKIYSSSKLTDEEKEYLYNEEFFEDILEEVNSSNYMKYSYHNKFDNITIKSFSNDEIFSRQNTLGYYNLLLPNKLYILDYDSIDEDNTDVIAHEFIHLCQDSCEYNMLKEATAEIVSYEYYPQTKMESYGMEVKSVKKIMEIIGSEPIWNYIFTGDFSMIEERVKPYLTDEEYKEFLDDLSFDPDNAEQRLNHKKSLDRLCEILYQNIYGKSIYEDKIINLIMSSDESLQRYYFNERYINDTYYYDFNDKNYQKIAYDEVLEIISLSDYTSIDPCRIETLVSVIDNEYNKQYISGYFPKKVYLEPITARFNFDKQKKITP
ncbi:MAG: hypothetical protein IJ565_03515 [Bacilli bacterium]|nr:hypothetical protein [Bacilli bacterium]